MSFWSYNKDSIDTWRGTNPGPPNYQSNVPATWPPPPTKIYSMHLFIYFILYSFKKWQIKSCRLQRDLISDCLSRRWSYWPLDLCSIFFSQTSLSSKFSLLAVWSDLFTINFVTKISYFGGFFKKCHFLSKNCCDTFWATFNKVWATFHFSIWLHCSLSWSVRLEVYLYFKLFIYF